MGLIDRIKKTLRKAGSEVLPDAQHNTNEIAEVKLAEGSAHETAGRHESALACYNDAISLQPELAIAHFKRANILLDRGDALAALDSYGVAIVLKPHSHAAHYNAGNAHFMLGNYKLAIEAYERAVSLKPEFAEAYLSKGVALVSIENHQGAIECFSRVVELLPNSVDALFRRGVAYLDLGNFEAATHSFKEALRIDSRLPRIHVNLGNALRDLGRVEEAVKCYQEAISIDPRLIEGHLNLANTLQGNGIFEQAIKSYEDVLSLDEDHFDALVGMGAALRSIGNHKAALDAHQSAVSTNPLQATGHLHLGITLAGVGLADAAIKSYESALAIEPDNADALLSLGCAQKDLGIFDQAIQNIQRALAINPDYILAYNNILFISNYVADRPPSQLKQIANNFSRAAETLAKPFLSHSNVKNIYRKLRIGFVSGDLYDHPVGNFLVGVWETLKQNASDRISLHAYQNRHGIDSTSDRLKACCETWRFIHGISDHALAQIIHEDQIDILIDLAGHTANNRLTAFAWRPAPVQASWLGYLATTGLKSIDYIIADSWTLPSTDESNFTEAIWRLPKSYLCFTPPTDGTPPGPLPAIQNGFITFGSCNNLTKMNDAVVATWSRVLNAVPESRLLLKSKQFQESSTKQEVVRRFKEHGINIDRLLLRGLLSRDSYLSTYQDIDIALDPFPYPGITTTVESLWMGVPVLTLEGNNFLSRQGVGLMQNAGLPDWIASNTDDYIAKSVVHTSNLRSLEKLRSELRNSVLASPLLDATQFGTYFEEALRAIWRKYCESDT